MDLPLVSIIIPVYNHAAAIEQSLDTVLTQTYRPLEIIMVNDGSTDGFEKMEDRLVKKYSQSTLKIKIFNQPNLDAGAARNRGFRESEGEYIIFWDADTLGKPEMIQKMYEALQQHPEASYAYSQFKFGWKKIKSQPFDSEQLQKVNFIDTSSLQRRKDFIPFDENLKRFQDWDRWLTLSEHYKTGIFIPEILYTKIKKGRKGKSAWLPSFWYQWMKRSDKVKRYEEAKKIVMKKHGLL
jgi:glycosyltransferase involved in cell wall biosynthesis